MAGLILALFAGLSFALSNALIRKGVYRSGESFSIIPIFAFIGMVLFGFPVFISGEAGRLAFISWLGLGALAAAGVLHFIAGRLLAYIGYRLIGANRSVPIQTSSILFAALLGVFLLGEPLTVTLVLAVLLIVGGVVLISTAGSPVAGKSGISEGSLVKGVLVGLGAALCWGISPILVKVGLKEVGSPLLATFVSYTAAAIVIGISLFHPRNRQKLRQLERTSLVPLIIAAVVISIAQLLRYYALSYSPVSLVAPLSGSATSLFIFPLSFLINREIETFSLRVIMGAVAIVAGICLIFWVA